MTETTAHDALMTEVRRYVERGDGKRRTVPGRKLYRAEPMARLVAARMFINKRVRITIGYRANDSRQTILTGQVVAVAENGLGLQSDVIVVVAEWEGVRQTRADSLACVHSIEEL